MNMQNNNSLTKPQAQQSQQQPSSASPASITLANTEPLVSSASSAARTQRVGKRERRKLYATEETHKNTGINSKNTNDVILTKWREKQVIFNNKDNYKKFINRNLLKFTKDELKGFYEEFETLPEFSKKIVKRLQDLNSGASILTTNPEVNEYLNNNVSLLTLTRGNILQIPENSLLYSILNDKFNTLTERQKKELLTEKKINRLRVDIESLNKKQLNKVLLVIDSIDPTIKQIILDKLAYLKQREKAARQQAQEAPNPAGRQLKPALQELNTESTTNSLSKINYQEMFAEFHKPPKPSNVVIQEQIANLPNHPAPGAGKNNSTALVVKGINNATSAIEALKMKEQTEKAAIIIKRLKRLEQFMRQRPELVQNFISEGISTFNRNELQYVLSYTNSKEILGDKIYKMVARTLAEKIQEENQNTSPTVRQFSQERTQEVPLSSLLTSSKNPVPNSNDFEEYQIREQAQASNERSPYNPTAFRNAASTGVGFDSVQNPGGVSASNGMRHNNNNLNISGINFTKLNSLNNKTLKKLVLEKNLQKLTSRQLKRLRRYKKIQYSIREGIIAGYQQRASFLQAQSRRNPKAAGLELKKKTGSSTA